MRIPPRRPPPSIAPPSLSSPPYRPLTLEAPALPFPFPVPRPDSGRMQVKDAAKRQRVEKAVKAAEAKAKTVAAADDDDDEVEALDDDVVAAVASRPTGGAAFAAAEREAGAAKLSKKAAKRAARRAAREEEEGYVGDGVWEKDGYEVVVAGDVEDDRAVDAAPAIDFLASRRDRHRRSKDMLLDPKTGKHARVGGVAEAKKRGRRR